MEDRHDPIDGHLDLPPPERHTPVRGLARDLASRLIRVLAPDEAKEQQMRREHALLVASVAETRLIRLVGIVYEGDVDGAGSIVSWPIELDEEHVRAVLHDWGAINVNNVANLLEVGDAIRHAPSTVTTGELERFSDLVSRTADSVARTLRNA